MKNIIAVIIALLFVSSNIAQVVRDHRTNPGKKNPVLTDINTPLSAKSNDAYNLADAPLATQAEIDEFNKVVSNQNGVGVLAGDNTRPFYYHTDQTNKAYIYQKLMDASRLPSGLIDHVKDHWYSVFLGDPISLLISKYSIEGSDQVKDWLVGRKATVKWIDCWYPIQNKQTLCGKAVSNSFICGQDYLHTELTIDKDVNIRIIPSIEFHGLLDNPWLDAKEKEELADTVEAEVRATHLLEYNTETNKSVESLTPHNPLLLQIPKDANVCVYGPWMADKLDIEGIGPDINFNNEIHPVNQLWYKNGEETRLTAIADGTGYFEKTGNNEIEASGLNHAMRFYLAFQTSRQIRQGGITFSEYDINGIGFDFTNDQANNAPPRTLSFKYNDNVRIKINDNSTINLQKTHSIFLDKVRMRSDGSVQGYIVIETVPIVKRGGSINITVKKNDHRDNAVVTPGSIINH
jgi:hypothetical protein